MPIVPQNVLNEIADDITIPGLTEETINIAGGLISSITDLELNVYIGDDRDVYFGYDLDFTLGISEDQHSLELRDNLLDRSMLQLHDDGTTTIHKAISDDTMTWQGNLALTDDALYIKTEL